MMFFPYRVDLNLSRLPWVTLVICAVCIYVFMQQLESHDRYVKAVNHFCENSIKRSTRLVLKRLEEADPDMSCAPLYISIREAGDPKARLEELVSMAGGTKLFKKESDQKAYILKRLTSSYSDFETLVPVSLTDEYAYNPLQFQVKQMFTSIMSHGSWMHLIFNLIFFFAFAASVEVITGSVVYTGVIMLMAVTTNLSYTFLSGDNALPTVGLSGVVMGMMALLSVSVPQIRIRCILWIVLYVRILRIPALFLAIWYIGWDIYNIQVEELSNINYIAHVSGAATGAMVALLYRVVRPDYLRGLIADS